MRRLVLPVVLCVALGLSGCLGGGREADMPVLEEEDHERREALAGEYRSHPAFARQWGLGQVNADQAYARLALEHGEDVAPGSGVTVGVLDSGIDTEHPAFAHTRVDEVLLPGATDEIGILPSHGTAVAGIIAGGRESTLPDGAHGVAWGADLAVFANVVEEEPPPEPDLPTEYFPIWSDILDEFDSDYAEELRAVLDWRDGERRIDFLNLSLGSHGIIDGYTETELRAVYEETINTIAQADADEKVVFVWAAGNMNGLLCTPDQPNCLRGMVVGASPGLEAGLAARIPELRGHTVAVVAVGEDGAIADYSNRCGLAAEWCIAAPGDGVTLAYFGPDEETGEPGVRGTETAGGTSFAAPMVAGGLAVMKHRFRGQLSNSALLARLLEMADRTGRYAEEKVYGRGLMDLDAATSPVGHERVTMGLRVEGRGHGLARTRLSLGAAMGDGVARSLARTEIVAFDALGAPFWYDLGSRMTHRAPSAAHSRLRGLLSGNPDGEETSSGTTAPGFRRADWEKPEAAGWELQLRETSAGPAMGHLGLAEDALILRHAGGGEVTLNAFSSAGMEGVLPVTGAGLSWRKGPIGLRSGWIAEHESALGTSTEGAFGKLAANAIFVGIEAGATLSAWRVLGEAEFGLTRPDPNDGLIETLATMATSAFALHAERAIGDDETIRFSVTQPLRVEAGRASLTLPVGRTKEGEVVREHVGADLVPAGRQVDLSARWQRRLGDGGVFRIGAYLSFDPGHSAGADPAVDLLAGYRLVF